MKNIDKKYFRQGIDFLAGVDEAGRGPLAGPVVAAAVILPKDFHHKEINDSKKLSFRQREKLFEVIIENAISYSFSVISHSTIDRINILNASLLAMKKSVSKLKPVPQIVLIDGNKSFGANQNLIPVVKGDSLSQSIASASIIAKVIRDKMMSRLAEQYSFYGWEKNKGYPTKQHIEALLKFGPSPVHRKTFLKKIMNQSFQSEIIFNYD
ncbi:Ribonuclease HII [Ignavibacterium album JCM 16511]|uniref:Ribonuclease HII n=1 Tax=Ignavibacterium album (strain DSM 19864 / JCM 16511 / NBRC 101810 / Mat9-16) TaxID=945713 RepID=I0AH85_IGNAJ|nr:ribonuclease HII [Ignavibacterium album]AFH48342.1 Ribonuclease HII [Ignavibacterium album JCM 16511]